MIKIAKSVALFCSVFLLISSIHSQPVTQITANDGATGDDFGVSVAISGDFAIVGALRDDNETATDTGSAYIFQRDLSGNWTQIQRLNASDAAANDEFGVSVAISGNFAIVGAKFADVDGKTNAGKAYIFERDQSGTWTQVPTQDPTPLTANDATANAEFGFSVAIDGNFAIVGAKKGGSASAGQAYIFERDQSGTWTQVPTPLTPSVAAANDEFGFAVSIDGNFAVVGARLADVSALNAGAAYIFENQGGTWTEVKKITGTHADDEFGRSVSKSETTIVVGSRFGDDIVVDSGTAYVFEKDQGGRNNWGLVKKISAADAEIFDEFGHSVSISGTTIVVGAIGEDDNGSASGAAYIFAKDQGGTNNWGQVKKITDNDGAANDLFGHAVAIDGTRAIIGSLEDNRTGAAFIHEELEATAVLYNQSRLALRSKVQLRLDFAADPGRATVVVTWLESRARMRLIRLNRSFKNEETSEITNSRGILQVVYNNFGASLNLELENRLINFQNVDATNVQIKITTENDVRPVFFELLPALGVPGGNGNLTKSIVIRNTGTGDLTETSFFSQYPDPANINENIQPGINGTFWQLEIVDNTDSNQNPGESAVIRVSFP